MKEKKRLDIVCVELRLFESREKAKRAIMAGDVVVNGNVIDDSSYIVKDRDIVELKKESSPYVSRAGIKLKAAIDYFKIELKDKICLDVGVASGGFSHCMLKEHAKKVYGIDVGRGQVHESLLKDKRFIFIPNTNARYLKPDIFDDKIDFVAVDVSFISLKLIIEPLIGCLNKDARIVLLVKPQFELKPADLKKGIVKNEELRQKALMDIIHFIEEKKVLDIIGFIDSPIAGAKGNKEFLLCIKLKKV